MDDDVFDDWVSLSENAPMGALFGERPADDVFTGALPGSMIHACANDGMMLLGQRLDSDSPLETYDPKALLDQLAILVAMQTARRIAFEFKGCTIDRDYSPDD